MFFQNSIHEQARKHTEWYIKDAISRRDDIEAQLPIIVNVTDENTGETLTVDEQRRALVENLNVLKADIRRFETYLASEQFKLNPTPCPCCFERKTDGRTAFLDFIDGMSGVAHCDFCGTRM